VTTAPTPGRSLVTKRAVGDLVLAAVRSVYGVSGFAGARRVGLVLDRAGLGNPGCRVSIGPEITVDLDLQVAYGLPVAEVARQVESAVLYTLRHALDREPDRVTIRIGHLRREHGIAPQREPAGPAAPGPAELAASGTDVA